ncbi:2,3-dihydroxyphenylpropionate/2,3-dihydroxicinnam ic acid 1,2-dioxygenase [Pseudomonas sp. CYM-20-01]|uniref:3-carboxyethylcatechol 2,3-dioxygenase n=1 Tax=Pseudomonas sp. CYM-20-01 TaxID=2870750 RepID=UPI002055D0EB|nr:3-carboxyethylcatechol 2,3-dioxygenase [Pseudomonas sp. CYM-20-01]BDB20766.1 2,3-dihydroxyphenylpropionate/2,3-dihydroxicinnam ic acid 1,2-dioxygenase [Pseudomonas sp. CYM-20-01]
MTLALCALSHSPLFGINNPGPETLDSVESALGTMRAFVRDFDPELTVIFGPDHFNGVFYDMMPAFCIGSGAISVGDWGTEPGPLPVDREAARRLVRAVLDAGIDVAQSERMLVDHGIVQSLEFLFGKQMTQPLIPVFVNAVGLPLGPLQRIRLLGEAIGREITSWDRRVLVIASGGLSHDPPIPRLEGATPEVAARLIDGRNPSPEIRTQRQQRVIAAGKAHALGDSAFQPINPAFDAQIMATLASGCLTDADHWSNEWIESSGGHSGHEIRAWLAAFAALSVRGRYQVTNQWYWPVDEWMTGFGMMIAQEDI